MVVVLISGKQGSGKSTLAKNILRANLDETKRIGPGHSLRFAQPLYEMHDAIRKVLMNYKYRKYDFEKKDGPLLQLLGTEWGRKMNDQIWVELLMNKLNDISGDALVTVEDCRFENEFDAFEGRTDVLRVRLEASKNTRQSRCEMWRTNDTHVSETGLDRYAEMGKFDLVVNADELDENQVLETVLAKIKEVKEKQNV